MISKIYNILFPEISFEERVTLWLIRIKKSKYYVNDNITHEYLDTQSIPRRRFFLKIKI
jgi:hypothetical protein